MVGREIDINRNVIERFLMRVRNFVRKNKKTVTISVLSVIAGSALLLAAIVIYQEKEKWDLAEFEEVLNKYRELQIEDEEERKKELQKTVNSLIDVMDSSYWGYVDENGYYIIADLYRQSGMDVKAKEYYLKFVENSPDSFFAPLALQCAGIINEKLGQRDEAFKIYQRLENKYEESIVTDEIFYNLGRVYQEKGELMKAREYFNKIVFLYPRSVFAEKAKKRLLLLGFLNKKEN